MMNRMKMIALLLTLVMTAAALVGCSNKAQTPDLTIEPDATVNEPAYDPETAEGESVAELGISMMQKPKTITAEMEQITFLIDNQTDVDYTTDMVQKLEMLVDGEWQEIRPVYDAVTMNIIVVPANTMTEITVNFNGYYENLEHGSYRLTKTLVDAEGNALELAAEFDVF